MSSRPRVGGYRFRPFFGRVDHTAGGWHADLLGRRMRRFLTTCLCLAVGCAHSDQSSPVEKADLLLRD
ncbi:hypothetical protein ACFL6C_08730, partial [Myxococcota bacterium]